MFEALRKFLQSRAGAAVTALIMVIGLVVVIVAVKSSFGDGGAAAMSADRVFIDADTGKPFEHELKIGEGIPVQAPSGKKSGYPAEACYWTKAGTPKTEPTWVLVNQWK